MTAPVVIVSRDSRGYAVKVEFYEDETAYYNGERTVLMVFEPGAAWVFRVDRRASLRLGWRATRVVIRLRTNPWLSLADVDTHTVPEPGAPLEPIPGRAA